MIWILKKMVNINEVLKIVCIYIYKVGLIILNMNLVFFLYIKFLYINIFELVLLIYRERERVLVIRKGECYFRFEKIINS